MSDVTVKCSEVRIAVGRWSAGVTAVDDSGAVVGEWVFSADAAFTDRDGIYFATADEYKKDSEDLWR